MAAGRIRTGQRVGEGNRGIKKKAAVPGRGAGCGPCFARHRCFLKRHTKFRRKHFNSGFDPSIDGTASLGELAPRRSAHSYAKGLDAHLGGPGRWRSCPSHAVLNDLLEDFSVRLACCLSHRLWRSLHVRRAASPPSRCVRRKLDDKP